jgi:diaminohydroxyphosphoribosylaminopyrimidine deaminase/5-amino-6-(5-phosphoribosylamino)uracil reductase
MRDDKKYMRRALELAAQGRGFTSPNPMVGCVIVRDGCILGEGYHKRYGGPHAEVEAVQAAGGDIRGATVYVTLEPCTHYGKTPPCADLLIKQQPQRVVVAMSDPNPVVCGRGIARLREAGIRVDVGLMEKEARRLNEAFITFITTGRPFVIAKCAMTLDGKIATRTGHSQWVTGEEAREKVHQLRSTVDAILVGSRTVMIDNPRLTARPKHGPAHDPVRIVLDAAAYLDTDRAVFHVKSKAPTWVATTKPREYPCAQEVLVLPQAEEGVDMRALMQRLGERNITSVLIEGGGSTLASAFEADIVDKVCFFIAPKIVGGRDAVTAVEGEGRATMDEAIKLHDVHVTPVGEDFLFEGYVRKAHVHGNH